MEVLCLFCKNDCAAISPPIMARLLVKCVRCICVQCVWTDVYFASN